MAAAGLTSELVEAPTVKMITKMDSRISALVMSVVPTGVHLGTAVSAESKT